MLDRARRWFLLSLSALLTAATMPQPRKKQTSCQIKASITQATATVTITAKAKPGTRLERYLLEWGDGTVVDQATVPPLLYTYQTGGTFTIRLTVWDSAGSSAWDTANVSAIIYVQPPPPTASGDTLTAGDFTYDGAYALPRSTGFGVEDTMFGTGLALRYEASDGVNQVHLLSAASIGDLGSAGSVYEWRDITPTIPGSPYSSSSYTEATIVKRYGDVFSGKRDIVLEGVSQDMIGWLDGCQGLYWDPTDSRLYWAYGYGYAGSGAGEDESNHFGYSTLNYGASTGTGNGPWRISGQSWKAMMGGIVPIPSAFASTYLGSSAVRLALGFGGYFSLIGSADASLGASLTAFTPPSGGATENVALSGTPLVGYWPVVGAPTGSNDEMTRPAYIIPGRPGADQTAWGNTKMHWNDRITAGVWIHGASKSGFLAIGNIGRDQNNYVNSTIAAEYHSAFWAIFSEAQLASVASGSAARYSIQPTSFILPAYPIHDPSSEYAYAAPPSYTIDSVSSDATKHVNGTDGAGTGALITLTGNHTLLVNDYVSVRGTVSPSSYDQIWIVGQVPSANSFRIFNGNAGSELWSGISGSGGTAVGPCTGAPSSATANHTLGAAFDPATNKLYVAVAKIESGGGGKVMILRYSVNC